MKRLPKLHGETLQRLWPAGDHHGGRCGFLGFGDAHCTGQLSKHYDQLHSPLADKYSRAYLSLCLPIFSFSYSLQAVNERLKSLAPVSTPVQVGQDWMCTLLQLLLMKDGGGDKKA